MRLGTVLSAQQARWLALEAQGLSRPRPAGPVGRARLGRLVEELAILQLDAVNVLARTQLIVPFSRLGAYRTADFHALSGPKGRLLEGWAHMASLTPMSTLPLLRPRMDVFFSGSAAWARRWEAWREENAEYIAATLDQVAQRGPLTAGMLEDPRPRQGEWWARRSVGRQALEWLFARGRLAAWRTPSFERVYDLPERVIPADILALPTPTIDECHDDMLLTAARVLGVGTAADLADYYRIPPTRARPRLAELVRAGQLVPVSVEGWKEPGFSLPDARPRRPRRDHATLVSPFDSLIWFRARAQRVFGFDYRIEIYVPEPKRRYGYFVLPLLLGDRLVARFDLKSDRRSGVLRVNGSYAEPEVDRPAVAEAAATELRTMAAWLGLDGVEAASRGDLAPALRRALA